MTCGTYGSVPFDWEPGFAKVVPKGSASHPTRVHDIARTRARREGLRRFVAMCPQRFTSARPTHLWPLARTAPATRPPSHPSPRVHDASGGQGSWLGVAMVRESGPLRFAGSRRRVRRPHPRGFMHTARARVRRAGLPRFVALCPPRFTNARPTSARPLATPRPPTHPLAHRPRFMTPVVTKVPGLVLPWFAHQGL